MLGETNEDRRRVAASFLRYDKVDTLCSIIIPYTSDINIYINIKNKI